MDLRELVDAILRGDLLTARQWVTDAQRARFDWSAVDRPEGVTARGLVVAAALVELLAERSAVMPPAWTTTVGAEREPLVLDPGLEDMPRSFAYARSHAPLPFRKRNLIALPDFLSVA